MIPFNEEPGYGGNEMSQADKMFEELGYKKNLNKKTIEYNCGDKEVIFWFEYKKYAHVWEHSPMAVETDLEEHLAIHEKLKELGWIK